MAFVKRCFGLLAICLVNLWVRVVLMGFVNCYIFHFKTWGLSLFNAPGHTELVLHEILVTEISHLDSQENAVDPQDHRADRQLQIYPSAS